MKKEKIKYKIVLGFVLLFIFMISFLIFEMFSYYKFKQESLLLKEHLIKYDMNKLKENQMYLWENYSKNPVYYKKYYDKMYSLLLPHLLIYKIKLKNNKPLEFYRIDNHEIYFVPKNVIDDADAFISYGIDHTCQYEDHFYKIFKKPVYAFDCGNTKNVCKEANFEPECIGTGKFRFHKNKTSNFKIHHFDEKIKQLGLQNKKLYIKLAICGAENEVIDDILKYSDNILAISFVSNFENLSNTVKAEETFSKIEKNFIPVTRNSRKISLAKPIKKYKIPYTFGIFDEFQYITYINKNLIKSSYLPFYQSNKVKYKEIYMLDKYKFNYDVYSNINPVIVLFEKYYNFKFFVKSFNRQ